MPTPTPPPDWVDEMLEEVMTSIEDNGVMGPQGRHPEHRSFSLHIGDCPQCGGRRHSGTCMRYLLERQEGRSQ